MKMNNVNFVLTFCMQPSAVTFSSSEHPGCWPLLIGSIKFCLNMDMVPKIKYDHCLYTLLGNITQ